MYLIFQKDVNAQGQQKKKYITIKCNIFTEQLHSESPFRDISFKILLIQHKTPHNQSINQSINKPSKQSFLYLDDILNLILW